MTATAQPHSTVTSRRALLAGALGGIGAWAASAIARTSRVQAADGATMLVGGEYTANTVTGLTATTEDAFYGTTTSGIAIKGTSSTSNGLFGVSGTSIAIWGHSDATDEPACAARSAGHNTGVQGFSGQGSIPTSPAKTGVFGYANQDATSVGVRGESPTGFGIYGKTTGTGFAGYFNGKTFMSQFIEIAEMTTPAAPGGNRARLFVKDNGLGKTQLCVRFPTGAVKVLATES
jgi:hypothetical protein